MFEDRAEIAIRFVAFFYSGVALYVYRRHIPLTAAVERASPEVSV